MRFVSLAAALAAFAVFGQPAWSAEKVNLKVLYAGNPGTSRTKDFVSFLNRHFAKVGETNYEQFKSEEADGYDVVIFDWTSIYPRDKDGKIDKDLSSGLHSPKVPKLSADFDRPAVLIGAAGGSLSMGLALKIDWL
jgi:hypothetical protein